MLVDRCGPPPEFPLASPCPGIVHHLSGPIARAHAPPPRRCGRDGPVVRPEPRGAGIPPQPARAGPHFHCATGRAGGRGTPSLSETPPKRGRKERAQRVPSPRPREAARSGREALYSTRAVRPPCHLRPQPFQADPEPVAAHRQRRKCARRGPASAGERSREEILPHLHGRPLPAELNPPGRLRGPHPFTSQRFHALLNSLFKVLFNFPLRYLSTIGLVPVFSLRWSLPPALGCIPKQPDSEKTGPRRGGGRYRPHTVHGLSLDQKDSGPRTTPGKRSSVRHTSHARLSDGDSALGSSLFARRY
ncbi:unnamed protein product [Pleuronectes platessa]|uniref:Uncharacterized protein n=1 Tax=Pleuronectes platessa TaxID=8262 RepID=A0A9N7V977_PLEPL|nr:unnamed protein product [Pleuronectes platessa]